MPSAAHRESRPRHHADRGPPTVTVSTSLATYEWADRSGGPPALSMLPFVGRSLGAVLLDGVANRARVLYLLAVAISFPLAYLFELGGDNDPGPCHPAFRGSGHGESGSVSVWSCIVRACLDGGECDGPAIGLHGQGANASVNCACERGVPCFVQRRNSDRLPRGWQGSVRGTRHLKRRAARRSEAESKQPEADLVVVGIKRVVIAVTINGCAGASDFNRIDRHRRPRRNPRRDERHGDEQHRRHARS